MRKASVQIDWRAGVLGCALVDPTVDEQLIIDPEAEAVVRIGIESVAPGKNWHDLADPPDREVIWINSRIRRAEAPVEVDCGIVAAEDGVREIGVIKIGSYQPLKSWLRVTVRKDRRDLGVGSLPGEQSGQQKEGRMTNHE